LFKGGSILKAARANRITQNLLRIVHNSEPNPVMGLRFDTLSRLVRDVVFVVDKTGKITHWNRAAEKTFGYSSSEIVGEPFYTLILPAEDNGIFDAEMKVLLQTGEGPLKNKEINVSLFHRDGHAVKVRMRFSTAEVDKKLSMIAVAQDRDLETEKGDIIRKAEIQSRRAALGVLAAGVIHDINNQAAVMLAYPDMILQSVKELFDCLLYDFDLLGATQAGSQIKEDLVNIKIAAVKIAELARNFMNFGSRGAENLNLFSSNTSIENVIKLFDYSFKQKKVELQKAIVSGLPNLLGHPEVFEQIIYNMLINAWQATPEKGKVEISAYYDENAVIIKISDTGCGIPAGFHDQIFLPFFTTKSKESGTGLGLSLVKRHIEEMGGGIRFRSKVGTGTIFILEFPIPE
jgi:PAS domain S-box-containing protein